MTLRFFRRIRVAPGLRVNLSKSGASVSIGRRGAWYTIGPRGQRMTVGAPGTGLFWTRVMAGRGRRGFVQGLGLPRHSSVLGGVRAHQSGGWSRTARLARQGQRIWRAGRLFDEIRKLFLLILGRRDASRL